MHPQLDAVLSRPFPATICIDGTTNGFKFPLDPSDTSKGFRFLAGLKKRLWFRFWKEHPVKKRKIPKAGWIRWPSCRKDGNDADTALDEAIRTGVAPKPRNDGCRYALSVWNHWREMGHTPVLSQLPVVFMNKGKTSTRLCTAGDYFTTWRNPYSQATELWLWELKTGWPMVPKKPHIMSPPLAYVDLLPWNRWHLQLMYTRLAYLKEMGIVVNQSRVIHSWKVTVNEGEESVGTDAGTLIRWVTKDYPPPDWVREIGDDEEGDIYYEL